MQNIFSNNPAFSLASLTQGINLIPNKYGRINQLGIFTNRSITQRTVIVEEQKGKLVLLPTKPVGSPGSLYSGEKRKVRSFVVPHIPYEAVITPDEIQGIRAFGSSSQEETVATVVARKLEDMRNSHAITLEYLRAGALRGQILDADGSVIYDLFESFGVTQKTVNFALNVATTKVKTKASEVRRHIEQNLMGELFTGIRVLCSPEFFDALTSHDNVEKAFAFYQGGEVLVSDTRKGFAFGGLIFEEYLGSVVTPQGTVVRIIPEGEAIAFPEGTFNTFVTYFAPADFNETANTLGLELYAKIESQPFDRGYIIHTQSNPLPLCLRPGVLVRLTAQ